MKLVKDIYNSFNSGKDGFSIKRMSAFAILMTILVVTIKHTDSTNLVQVIAVLSLFTLMLFGLIDAHTLVQLRTGVTTKETTTDGTTGTVKEIIKEA